MTSCAGNSGKHAGTWIQSYGLPHECKPRGRARNNTTTTTWGAQSGRSPRPGLRCRVCTLTLVSGSLQTILDGRRTNKGLKGTAKYKLGNAVRVPGFELHHECDDVGLHERGGARSERDGDEVALQEDAN